MAKIFNKILRILSGSKYLLFLNITEKIFFFLLFLFLARSFSSEVYGQCIIIYTLANIFVFVFDLGLPIYLQKEIATDRTKTSELLSKINTVYLIVFILYLFSLTVFYKLFYGNIHIKEFYVILVSVYLLSFTSLLNTVLSGLNIFKLQFYYLFIIRLLTAILILTTVYFLSGTLFSILTAFLICVIIHIALLIFSLKKMNVKMTLNFDFINIYKVIKISFPLALAVIFNFLYDKIDLILISKFTNDSHAAFYNVGYGLYKSSSIAFSFLMISGFTRASYLSRNIKALKVFFIKYSRLLLILTVPIAIILFLFSKIIIENFYTLKYTDSVIVLKILAFGITAMALNNLTGVILNAKGLLKENMYVTLFGLVINIVFNIIFIPIYGIIAAAVISILTEYFIFAGDYFYLNKIMTKH